MKLVSLLFIFACGHIATITALAAETPIGIVKRMKGDVTIFRSGKTIAAKQDEKLFNGDRVKTGKDAMAQLEMNNAKMLFVGKESETMLRQDPDRPTKSGDKQEGMLHVGMVYGKIRAAVGGKEKDNTKMKVYSGNAVAGVRGTEFHIMREAKSGTNAILSYGGSVDFQTRTDGFKAPKDVKPIHTQVPPGTYSMVGETRTAMLPIAVDKEQIQELKTRDVNGRKTDTVATHDGKAVTLKLNSPLGVRQALQQEKVENKGLVKLYETALNADDDLDAPPKPTVMVDLDSARVSPVVPVTTSMVEKASLKAFKKPEEKRLLEGYVKSHLEVAKLQRERIQAKIKNDPKEIKKVELKLLQARVQEMKAQKKVFETQSQAQKELLEKQLPAFIKKTEASKNLERKAVLEKELAMAKLESTTTQKKIKLTDLQSKLYQTRADLMMTPRFYYSKEGRPMLVASTEVLPTQIAQESAPSIQLPESAGGTDSALEAEIAKLNAEIETGDKAKTEVKESLVRENMKNTAKEFAKYLPKEEAKDGVKMVVKNDAGTQFTVKASEDKVKDVNLGSKVFEESKPPALPPVDVINKVVLSDSSDTQREPASETSAPLSKQEMDFCTSNPSECGALMNVVASNEPPAPTACSPGDPACAGPSNDCSSNPTAPGCMGQQFANASDTFAGGSCSPGDPTCFDTAADVPPPPEDFMGACDCIKCSFMPTCSTTDVCTTNPSDPRCFTQPEAATSATVRINIRGQ